jgi:hypothetical protein
MTKVFKVLWEGKDGLTQENFLFAGSKGDALRKFTQRKFSGVKRVKEVVKVVTEQT